MKYEHFINFLKINNIFDIFQENLKTKRLGPNIELSDLFKKLAYKSNIIYSAFAWHNTKQGGDFWLHYSMLWCKIIINKYEKQT